MQQPEAASMELEPAEGEETIELPDYDTRRLIHARDPLCAVDACRAAIAVRCLLVRLYLVSYVPRTSGPPISGRAPVRAYVRWSAHGTACS